MFTAQDNTKLREHLKGYAVMAIAGQSGLSVQTVARFMDGAEGYEDNEREFLPLFFALKRLQQGLHSHCGCEGCQGVRNYANGASEMPMSLQILLGSYRNFGQLCFSPSAIVAGIAQAPPPTPRAMPLRTRRMNISGVLFVAGQVLTWLGAGASYASYGKLGIGIMAVGLTCLVASFGVFLADKKGHQV